MQTIETPQGEFLGTVSEGVAQYRGVPFGTIPGRFKRSVMTENVGRVHCTKQGPICPQDVPYSDSYLGVDPDKVKPIEYNVDELNCLNLFITAPANPTSGPIPVVVWIHGGSNTMGTAYRGVYDPFEWVKTSIKISKPVIVVLVQFRVHVFGFLPFKGIGNFGLMDQKLGIDWTYKYIQYWGGDSSRISVFGQSSGSQCAYVQSCHPDKRFRQAAYLSGSIDQFKSRTIDEFYEITQKLCAILKCSEDDLETVPWQDLVKAFRETNVAVLCPVDDGVFLPKGGYDLVPCLDAVLLSDCIRDGAFFADNAEPGDLVRKIGPYLAESLDITTNEDVCRFLTSQIFFKGNYKASKKFEAQGTRAYIQCFDATNPIHPELGNAHMVDLFYFMGSYKMLPVFERVAKQVQDTLCKFAYFDTIWDGGKFALVTDKIDLKSINLLPDYRDFSVLDVDLDFSIIQNIVTGW